MAQRPALIDISGICAADLNEDEPMQGGSFYEKAASAFRGLARRRPPSNNMHSGTSAPTQTAQGNLEKVRLVIWDLDDTFWRGTLTEGGIEYLQENHDTVIELANRGIMSSICSRNDHNNIEALLRGRDIWDYFIFPSIDWTSKGPRLKRIVDACQLRAPTILFIDDNPMNRAEATRFVDGIRVADPANMKSLLEDPLLQGKEDRALTRLAQYKLLERRSNDMTIAGDNIAFLRESGIKVYIEHDIESNLDRAIELVNRTNQLNFTKVRLPEDQELARRDLRYLLSGMEKQAGLVRVVDRYGDYGYCGFYVQNKSLHGTQPKLVHYCFSCRTLGMEVETWLYRRLGRPDLEVSGEVLTDVINSEKVIDWISMETVDPSSADARESVERIPRIYVRGGCEVVALSHYFEILTEKLVCEFAFQREGLPVRLDHSEMLKLSLEEPADAVMQSLLALGYQSSDFATSFLDNSEESCVYILGLWAEANHNVFRHTTLGFRTLFYLNQLEALPQALSGHWEGAVKELRENFEFEGLLSPENTQQNILSAVEKLPDNSLVFLIGPTEKTMDHAGILHDYMDHIALNDALRACEAKSYKIVYVGIDDYIKQEGDRLGAHNHYSREVYFRLFSGIRAKIDDWSSRDGKL